MNILKQRSLANPHKTSNSWDIQLVVGEAGLSKKASSNLFYACQKKKKKTDLSPLKRSQAIPSDYAQYFYASVLLLRIIS